MNIKQMRAALAQVAGELPNIRHPIVYVEDANAALYEVTTVEADMDNDIVVIHIKPEPTDI